MGRRLRCREPIFDEPQRNRVLARSGIFHLVHTPTENPSCRLALGPCAPVACRSSVRSGPAWKTWRSAWSSRRSGSLRQPDHIELFNPAGRDGLPTSHAAARRRPGPVGRRSMTPGEIAYYGIITGASTTRSRFGTANPIQGDGAGQTIAIVDAYDDPALVDSTAANFATSDLARSTSTSACRIRPASQKIEPDRRARRRCRPSNRRARASRNPWTSNGACHARRGQHRPRRGHDGSVLNLFTAEAEAASLPGVSVVSNSWGGHEIPRRAAVAGYFTTPTGHQGITFLASTGDSGALGVAAATIPFAGSPAQFRRTWWPSAARACPPLRLTDRGDRLEPGRRRHQPVRNGAVLPGSRPELRVPDDPRRLLRRRPELRRRGRLRLRSPSAPPTRGPDRRHQPGLPRLGRPRRHRRPGTSPRRRDHARRRGPDPAGPLLAPLLRLQRYRGRRQRRTRDQPRLRHGHRPGHPQGQPADPRPGGLRSGHPDGASSRSQ